MEMKFEEKPIEDIQARKDYRNISIDRVGVCDLKIPLKIRGCEIDSEKRPERSGFLEPKR